MEQTTKYSAGSVITDIKGREFLYLGKALLYKNGSRHPINRTGRNRSQEVYLPLAGMESVIAYSPAIGKLYLQFNELGLTGADTYVQKKKAVSIKDEKLECSVLKCVISRTDYLYSDVYRIVQL